MRQTRQNSPAWQARGAKIAQKARERWANPEFREKRISQLTLEGQGKIGRSNQGRHIIVDDKHHFPSINQARAYAHENGMRLRILSDHTGEFYYATPNGARPITILGYRFTLTMDACNALGFNYYILSKYRKGEATPVQVRMIEAAMKEWLDGTLTKSC
jgi:hypothetical protein